jgi:hypothetical protein
MTDLLFKQAAGSAHRAVIDIRVHFERGWIPAYVLVNYRESPAKSTRGYPECATSSRRYQSTNARNDSSVSGLIISESNPAVFAIA